MTTKSPITLLRRILSEKPWNILDRFERTSAFARRQGTGALRPLPWLYLAAVVLATVSPIGWRPHGILSADLDRAAAFAGLTLLFIVVFPHRWLFCALLLVAGAGAIKLLQYLSSTRHPRLDDAAVKAAGAAAGTMIGWIANRFQQPT